VRWSEAECGGVWWSVAECGGVWRSVDRDTRVPPGELFVFYSILRSHFQTDHLNTTLVPRNK